jgi:hypothetical protein
MQNGPPFPLSHARPFFLSHARPLLFSHAQACLLHMLKLFKLIASPSTV